jgi:hypothetical protein
MDSRVRATELRQIKTGSTNAVEAGALTPSSTGIGIVVSDNAPCHFRRIVGGKYYSKRVTGDVDRVEIYLASDTDASSGGTILVSGISLPYDVSDNYVVSDINPASQDRPSWLDALPSGVTSSILYSAGQDIQESDPIALITKSQVASYSTNGTVTDAVIVFTTSHGFKIGDIVDTSELGSPYDGLDGIFKITATTSNSITYKFAAELADPINSATPTSDTYVYSVVQKKVSIGDTWIDSSTTPSTTYYWDGLRWTLSRSAATDGTQDTLAPANVTNIQSTTSAYTIDGGIARARVFLTWDAPTKNSDDTDLTDLAGYEVWTNYTGFTGPWTEKTGVLSANTSTILSNLNQNVPVYFKVFAVDSSLNRSEGTEYSTTTGILALELAPPTAPTLTTRLGTVTVSWNGLQKNPDNTESNPPTSIRLIEVHASTTTGFTPDSTTLKGTMVAGSANYTVISGLDYTSSWYFKLVAVDVNGNKTSGSVQSATNIAKTGASDITAGTITANELNVGNVGANLVSANVLKATNPAGTSGFEINSNYLRAFSATLGNTFVVNGTTGVVTVGTNTIISGNSITTGTINASAVAVTNLNANNITSGTINANTVSVTNLNASNITFGTLNGNNVTVQNLNANAITAGSFSGDRITGGTITGTTISGGTLTTAGSRHVEISGTSTKYFDDDGVQSGYATASGTGSASVFTISNGGFVGGGIASLDLYNGGADLNGPGSTISAGLSGMGAIQLSSSGGIYIEGVLNNPLRIATGGDLTPTSTAHAFQIGDSSGINLRMDNNEIAGMNNGVASGIYIQQDGGDARLGNTTKGIGISGGTVFANGVYGVTLTTSYRSVYVSNTNTYNELGYVASSRRYKKNIEPLALTAEQILSVVPVQYHYNQEEDSASKHAGMIAEDMHDAGLGGYVSYDEDGLPQTISYEFYVSALQLVARHHDSQIKELTSRIAALESK